MKRLNPRTIPNSCGVLLVLLVAAGAGLIGRGAEPTGHAAGPCDPPVTNPVLCENSLAGTPESEWDVPFADEDLEGFATQMSVDQGQQIQFKIKTNSTNYRIEIYRLGYYGGDGARLVATIQPSAALPQPQPACLSDASTGLVDCGNWGVSASWNVPASAVSGVYIAKLVREDPADGRANHIYFVVRDDDGRSDLLFQTADTTWQAYNSWGGNSLYSGQPDNRAYKVSYNRPFITRHGPVVGGNESFLFSGEYPMIRWLEANGYNVSYSTGIDTDRLGSELLEHKVFLSVGHDEYWSNAQRSNVETARNSGVNLAFFSGNEVFWKTRWEPSLDASASPYRTLVSYKETKAGAKIDPSPEWTGTWRDPRLSPPSDGGRPENALTGQLFMVNGVRNWEMHVPAEDGKLRFWRNTSIATLAPGTTATLPLGTLGYEWDEVVDNGQLPPGIVKLSHTTHDVSPLYLQDYGNTYGSGMATHSLTFYRHSSGALVFGAGTVQWAWGLDDHHDGNGEAPDARMQQATANLLADMGTQPGSLQAGLIPATASSDQVAPTSQITSPAQGGTVTTGAPVTITGTASDVGGQVGGVEVSTDGGATWHLANGRTSWSYIWTPTDLGTVNIKSRAVDDSGNLESPSGGISVTVDFGDCPCVIWPSSTVPAVPSQSDPQAVEVGLKFRSMVDGYVTGIRFYKGPANSGIHTGNLWTSTGILLATGTFSNETSTGWQELNFSAPVAVTANTTYVASYHTTSGGYAVNQNYFSAGGVTNLPLRALASGEDGANGLYRYGATSAFPTETFQGSNYWVQPVFTDVYTDTSPPTVSSFAPAAGATQILPSTGITARFSEDVVSSSITFAVTGPGNSNVSGSVTYDGATRTATFQPSAPLSLAATYQVTVSGAKDLGDNLMAPVSWSFTTVSCPCSLWPNSFVPTGSAQSDGQPVELGLKFRAEMDGWITGVRFYKTAGNTGTHVGSLWTSSGTLLARSEFTAETAGGWQEVTFAAPVQIAAGTTYIVSYHNPTGSYLVSFGFLANSGIDQPPLHALRNGEDGGNGLFSYGQPAFPTQSFNASNYWVDVAFSAVFVDPVPPAVSSQTPAPGSTRVSADSSVAVVFTEPVTPGSISLVLRRPDNSVVGSTVSYDSGTRTALLVPGEQLAQSTTYTAFLSGATDLAGNPMSPVSWSFTTVGCPCSIWDSSTAAAGDLVADGLAVELGLKFRPTVDGYVTGIRFYKTPGNTGIHTGSLWTSSGVLLASGPFLEESGSGWQQLSFANPVQVSADTLYVVSYHNPAGNYLAARNAFSAGLTAWPLVVPSDAGVSGNGVFKFGATGFPTESYQASNYWVDVAFTVTPPGSGDTTGPSLTGIQATNLSTSGATVRWNTDEPSTTQVEYGLSSNYGSMSPGSPANVLTNGHEQQLGGLLPNTLYHYRVISRDVAGNMAISGDQTFTTIPPDCPCSIWAGSVVPGTPSHSDTQPFELGVRFQSDINGWITGIRFYKGPANTGTHTGSLWSSDGQLLATATFANETATGWQQVNFSSPVAVVAGATYVASYHTDVGGYARDEFYFANGPTLKSPLRALQNGSGGGNGVFAAGSTAFPSQSFNATNYWVDVVFMHVATDTVPPSLSSIAASSVTESSATITWTTDEPATTLVEYGPGIAYGLSAPSTPSGQLSSQHSQQLQGLNPGTTYHYRVISSDSSGNTATSSDFTFTTSSPMDSTPPVISGVQASGVTHSAATISWTTDEGGTSQVEFGNTVAYGSLAPSVEPGTLVTQHQQALQGLTASTVYHYRVRSRDAAGNLALSGDFTFTTSPPPDTTPPAISAVTSAGVGVTSATVQWTTDEAATTQVEYGITTGYGSLAPPTPGATLTTTHSQALSGLDGNTTYHYRVRSKDAAGNEAISGDFTFTTSGNALKFDGSNDRATVNDAASLDLSGPLTLEAWVKFDNVTRDWWQTLIFKRGTSSNLAYALYYHDGVWFEIRSGNTNAWVWDRQRLQTGVWYHIAATYDRSNLRVFVNGQLTASAPFTGPVITSTYPVQLGFNSVWTFEQFHGTLDEVRISSVARYTSSFPAPAGRFPNDPTTVALWHLDEGSGQTSADSSGNGNTLRRGASTSNESSDPAWVGGSTLGLSSQPSSLSTPLTGPWAGGTGNSAKHGTSRTALALSSSPESVILANRRRRRRPPTAWSWKA